MTAKYKLIKKKLGEKKKELLEAKKQHKKLAGEFIDLWMNLKKLEKV